MVTKQAFSVPRFLKVFPRLLSGYPLAVGAVFMALLGTQIVQSSLSVTAPFLAFIVAIMVSAWHSGLRPALLATGLSAVVIDYYLLAPHHGFQTSYPDLLALSLFLVVGALISYCVSHLQQARQQATAIQHQLKKLYLHSSRLLEKQALDPMLKQVLSAAIGFLHAEKGVIQLYDHSNESLRLMAQVGFPEEFTEKFQLMPADFSTCGAACQRRRRVVVQNIDLDHAFHHLAPVLAHYGVAAVQSTPLFGKDRQVFAVLSTYTSTGGEPSEARFHLLDLYLRQAESILQSKYQEEQLRHANEDLKSCVHMKTSQLAEKDNNLQQLMSELSVTEERERQKLAVELHDYLAQMLVLARLKLGLAKQALPKLPPVTTRYVDEADDVLRQSLEYARTLMAELCPPELYQAGLPAGLRRLAEQMPKHGLSVDLDLEQDIPALPEETAVFLYRSIREVLINAIKHARVDRATVSVKNAENDTLLLVVKDRGEGFDPGLLSVKQARGHFGIASIQQRMAALGGLAQFHSSPGVGTTVTLTVPLHGSLLRTAPLRAASAISHDRVTLSTKKSAQRTLPI